MPEDFAPPKALAQASWSNMKDAETNRARLRWRGLRIMAIGALRWMWDYRKQLDDEADAVLTNAEALALTSQEGDERPYFLQVSPPEFARPLSPLCLNLLWRAAPGRC